MNSTAEALLEKPLNAGIEKTSNTFKTASPIMLGYVPVSMTFGVMASQLGFSLPAILGFSIFAYSGSAQFAALSILAAGNFSIFAIFSATWLIGLRHIAYALAYSTFNENWTFLQKLRFYPLLTDETFAALVATPSLRSNPKNSFQVCGLGYCAWIFGATLGFLTGRWITHSSSFGLDFAPTAFLIGILTLLVRTRTQLLTVFTAIFASILFHQYFGQIAILLTGIFASLVGMGSTWKQN